MNPITNKFEQLSNSDHAEQLKALRELTEKKLDAAVARDEMNVETAERLKAAGPVVFKEGEIIELRGYRWRVGRIDARKLVLRPVAI